MSGAGDAGGVRRALPAYDRGCYGCFGPMETPNTAALARRWSELGASEAGLVRVFRTFNANAQAFRKESERMR